MFFFNYAFSTTHFKVFGSQLKFIHFVSFRKPARPTFSQARKRRLLSIEQSRGSTKWGDLPTGIWGNRLLSGEIRQLPQHLLMKFSIEASLLILRGSVIIEQSCVEVLVLKIQNRSESIVSTIRNSVFSKLKFRTA